MIRPSSPSVRALTLSPSLTIATILLSQEVTLQPLNSVLSTSEKSMLSDSQASAPAFLWASLERSFCSCRSSWNLSISTDISFSETISLIKSIGKPNVSFSLNASSPERTLLSALAIISSSICIPCLTVLLKESSSASITLTIKSRLSRSSG